ncbi:MAG: hypothetical protein KF760_18900 [Candidatus Eremiobacteraeota bacterium]|nr:hypothetical protein [Candidatus Eremiobacteraeota bacterium]MCW5868468.1 hypothetical protein [Candidatus Eremiobacteraeota bacterium]
MKRRLALTAVLILGVSLWWLWPRRQPLSEEQWRALVSDASEAPQPFLSDNWISNESDYGSLVRALDVSGGVYLGVGPEQNFTYLARLQPDYAFIVDIRRGNLLQHLYYKVLFEECPTPQQWLAGLCGRRPPQGSRFPDWLQEVDRQPLDESWLDKVKSRGRRLLSIGSQDELFLAQMQRVFLKEGLQLAFRYRPGAPEQEKFPTLGEVLSDPECFLARPDAYARVRRMQLENRIIPLVGDFAGRRAFPSVARWCRRRNLRVSAVYASNVDFYLMPRGLTSDKMEDFVLNLQSLPRDPQALLLRFHLWSGQRPLFWPRLQRLDRWLRDYQQGKMPDYASGLEKDDLLNPPSGRSVRPRS